MPESTPNADYVRHFYQEGDRVRVNVPGHPQLDNGYHEGDVLSVSTNERGIVMVGIRFDEAGVTEDIAFPYVENLTRNRKGGPAQIDGSGIQPDTDQQIEQSLRFGYDPEQIDGSGASYQVVATNGHVMVDGLPSEGAGWDWVRRKYGETTAFDVCKTAPIDGSGS